MGAGEVYLNIHNIGHFDTPLVNAVQNALRIHVVAANAEGKLLLKFSMHSWPIVFHFHIWSVCWNYCTCRADAAWQLGNRSTRQH